MQKQTTISFKKDDDKMEIIVEYNTREHENFTVVFAYHNGNDITDFYRLLERQNEHIFYKEICQGIALEICDRRKDLYNPLSGNGTAYAKRA